MKKLILSILIILFINVNINTINAQIDITLQDEIKRVQTLSNNLDSFFNRYKEIPTSHNDFDYPTVLDQIISLTRYINVYESIIRTENANLRDLYFASDNPKDKLTISSINTVLLNYLLGLNYLRTFESSDKKEDVIKEAFIYKEFADNYLKELIESNSK